MNVACSDIAHRQRDLYICSRLEYEPELLTAFVTIGRLIFLARDPPVKIALSHATITGLNYC